MTGDDLPIPPWAAKALENKKALKKAEDLKKEQTDRDKTKPEVEAA